MSCKSKSDFWLYHFETVGDRAKGAVDSSNGRIVADGESLGVFAGERPARARKTKSGNFPPIDRNKAPQR